MPDKTIKISPDNYYKGWGTTSLWVFPNEVPDFVEQKQAISTVLSLITDLGMQQNVINII